MGVAAFAEAVAVPAEPAFKQRIQRLRQRLLDDAIQHGRHTQRSAIRQAWG